MKNKKIKKITKKTKKKSAPSAPYQRRITEKNLDTADTAYAISPTQKKTKKTRLKLNFGLLLRKA